MCLIWPPYCCCRLDVASSGSQPWMFAVLSACKFLFCVYIAPIVNFHFNEFDSFLQSNTSKLLDLLLQPDLYL